MAIDVFAFDWSGVISDDRKPVYHANMRMLADYGKTAIPFAKWLRMTQRTIVEFMESNGVVDSPERFSALYQKYFTEFSQNGMRPFSYPEAGEVLESLKNLGKTLTVLSYHPAPNLETELERYGLASLFAIVHGGVRDKTAELEGLYKSLDVDPHDVIYTGDMVFDIRAAKAAGVRSAGVCTGYHTRAMLAKEEPTYLFRNLAGLKVIA